MRFQDVWIWWEVCQWLHLRCHQPNGSIIYRNNIQLYITTQKSWPLFRIVCSDFHWRRPMFQFQCLEFTPSFHCWVDSLFIHTEKHVFGIKSKFIFSRIAPAMMTVKNRPNVSHWSLETGYLNVTSENSYPIRVNSAQQNSALRLNLQLFDDDLEYLCRVVPGFKIYLHTPGEMVKMNGISYRVASPENDVISIKPTLTITSERLRSYDPNQRQCFFDGERQLRFFKLYAHQNCELECLTNYTLHECGCVRFSMPSIIHLTLLNSIKFRC